MRYAWQRRWSTYGGDSKGSSALDIRGPGMAAMQQRIACLAYQLQSTAGTRPVCTGPSADHLGASRATPERHPRLTASQPQYNYC